MAVSLVNKTVFTSVGGSHNGSITLTGTSTIRNWLLVVNGGNFVNLETFTTDQGETIPLFLDNVTNYPACYLLHTTKTCTTLTYSNSHSTGKSNLIVIYELSGNNLTSSSFFTTFNNGLTNPFVGPSLIGPGSTSFYISVLGTTNFTGIAGTSLTINSGWTLDKVFPNGANPQPYIGSAYISGTGTQQATFTPDTSATFVIKGFWFFEGSSLSCPLVQLINGGFQDSNGNVLVNGYLELELSEDAQLPSSLVGSTCAGQVCGGIKLKVPLDVNGNVQSTPPVSIWGNDNMIPAITYYTVKAFNSKGQLCWGPQTVTITGSSTFNCNTWTSR